MYPKDLYKAKYQYLINVRESVGLNCFNDPETFIEYSNDIRDVYKNIDKYNDPEAFIEYSNDCKMFTKILMNTILSIQMICKIFMKTLMNTI